MTLQPTTELDLGPSRPDFEYRRRDSGGYPAERYGLFDEAALHQRKKYAYERIIGLWQ